MYKQIAGLIARRIVFDKQAGEHVAIGERIGLMKFGSRMDVLLGPEWKILVNLARVCRRGDTVGREESTYEPDAPYSVPPNLTRTVDRRPTRVAYALPTFFTAGNMFFGFVSLMKAFEGAMLMAQQRPGAEVHFVLAAQMIGLAVLLDGLDGRIARMTNTTSDFGREMDSMADAITFGVAPAVLGFAWGILWHRHERECVRQGPPAPPRILRLLSVPVMRVRAAGPVQRHNQPRSEKSRACRTANISWACRFLPPLDWLPRLFIAVEGSPLHRWPHRRAVARAAGTAGVPDGLYVAVSQLQGSEPERPQVPAVDRVPG